MLIDTPVNKITHEILAAAIEVHRIFGPALFERVYEPCFHYELGVRQLHFETQRVVPILYKGMQFGASYRVDLIVEGAIVVETKCVEALSPVHRAQTLTYMKLTNCPFGLLINFNVPKLMDGVRRLVLPGHEWTTGLRRDEKESPMSWIRERDPPFLRCSVLHYSVVSTPSASVASRTELPQMMIEVLVLRHTPFRARHPSEEGMNVAVAPPFSL